ncbi:hypothetical protein L228DRAFT_249113 [Xylona heveae TC161]|uniref:60S ribosomal subunit assembly/export protein LOC1 n=1 Tax=Xylona heveae (strain CBS 132557 / TC161) TaxID=1328760 RepID=A0A165FS51_XYLHT|nr:hypothetical protein L228DRAFT_249113 [Xylona heveae TC161]KZF21309.1 hypothetical protein L228DRAFT_249113 [Xylona heveae TC161]
MAPIKSSAKTSSKKPGKHVGDSKSRVSKSKPSKAPPAKEQKSKPLQAHKKKRKEYSEAELGIPKLNMITPVGVQKPKGKKKGKVFVDDQESMMTILAMVNADKEGQIESKMMKARQVEEIREARKREAEARHEQKNSKLEATKDALRKKRKRRTDGQNEGEKTSERQEDSKRTKPAKKRVSFA